MNEKIFISIASFRDPTLIITIKSALLHAKHPENLVFGVGAQYYDDEFPDFTIAGSQIKVIKYNPDTAPGVGKVRYEISKLVTNEKYFFMIDSHVLFAPGWDEAAKDFLEKAKKMSKHERVCVVSPDFKKDDQIPVFSIAPRIFEEEPISYDFKKNLPILGRLAITFSHSLISTKEMLIKHYFIRCGSLLTYSVYLNDVGLDPHSDFLHEEAYLSWKTYVSGWDLYLAANNLINQNSSAYFNIVWNDDPDLRSYTRKKISVKDEIAMFYAMILDKKNKFSAKNQRRSSEDFWNFAGSLKEFKKIKSSKVFNDLDNLIT
jgi:hypothetical protein